MSDGEGTEPDWTRSCPVSRRGALALGVGAVGSLAGCNAVSNIGTAPATEATDEEAHERTIEVRDQSIDSVEFDARLVESLREHEEIEFTVRAYTRPNLDPENWSQVGATTVTQSIALETHSMDWDLPLGYAQQLRFTIEMVAPVEEAEKAVTTEMVSPQEEREAEATEKRVGGTIVPFYNAARDTEMVLAELPATPEGDWAYADPYFKTDFWFDSPAESPFDTPAVPEDEYDQDWYDYRNITMTAVVRFPTYENITEFQGSKEDAPTHSPTFDWVVVNLSLDAWELIEATRWNSIATQKLESGEYAYGDGSDARVVDGKEDYGSSSNPSSNLGLDAAEQTHPFTAYASFRYAGVRWDEASTNPLLLNGGRPFSKRAAEKLEAAFDNPNFNTLEHKEYHKAIALQVFVGQNLFGYTTGEYVSTPEETVNKWYEISTGQRESAGNCQDATAMYGGIAVHLLDSTYGVVGMQGNVGYHIQGGLLDLQKPAQPYEVWPDHPSPMASDVFTFETEHGTVSPVECTLSDPTIGWKNADGSDYELLSYLSDTGVHSHIPVNTDYEPDVDGTVYTEHEPQIPWEFHEEFTTIEDVEKLRTS